MLGIVMMGIYTYCKALKLLSTTGDIGWVSIEEFKLWRLDSLVGFFSSMMHLHHVYNICW
jgi:hypothetical protein